MKKKSACLKYLTSLVSRMIDGGKCLKNHTDMTLMELPKQDE